MRRDLQHPPLAILLALVRRLGRQAVGGEQRLTQLPNWQEASAFVFAAPRPDHASHVHTQTKDCVSVIFASGSVILMWLKAQASQSGAPCGVACAHCWKSACRSCLIPGGAAVLFTFWIAAREWRWSCGTGDTPTGTRRRPVPGACGRSSPAGSEMSTRPFFGNYSPTAFLFKVFVAILCVHTSTPHTPTASSATRRHGESPPVKGVLSLQFLQAGMVFWGQGSRGQVPADAIGTVVPCPHAWPRPQGPRRPQERPGRNRQKKKARQAARRCCMLQSGCAPMGITSARSPRSRSI